MINHTHNLLGSPPALRSYQGTEESSTCSKAVSSHWPSNSDTDSLCQAPVPRVPPPFLHSSVRSLYSSMGAGLPYRVALSQITADLRQKRLVLCRLYSLRNHLNIQFMGQMNHVGTMIFSRSLRSFWKNSLSSLIISTGRSLSRLSDE